MTDKIMCVDVESNGLWGEPISIGFSVEENLESFDFNNKGNDKHEWNNQLYTLRFGSNNYIIWLCKFFILFYKERVDNYVKRR